MVVTFIKELIDSESISRFEKENNVIFEKEFVEFFLKNNGGRPEGNICQISGLGEKIVNNFLSFNVDDKDNIFKAKKRIEEDVEGAIPFAKDPAGNYYCILDRKIVFAMHDSNEIYPVCDTFSEFLEMVH